MVVLVVVAAARGVVHAYPFFVVNTKFCTCMCTHDNFAPLQSFVQPIILWNIKRIKSVYLRWWISTHLIQNTSVQLSPIRTSH